MDSRVKTEPNNRRNQSIRQCELEMFVGECFVAIRFPCHFFIQWKTVNNKHNVLSVEKKKIVNGKLEFNQTFCLNVNLIYDQQQNTYLKKQSLLLLNLVSNSRPTDPKLVGRVQIDLADIANGSSYQKLAPYQLKYCSVQSTIMLRGALRGTKQSQMSMRDLDKSDISDIQSMKFEQKSDISQKDSSKAQSRVKSKTIISEGNQLHIGDRISAIKNQASTFRNSRYRQGQQKQPHKQPDQRLAKEPNGIENIYQHQQIETQRQNQQPKQIADDNENQPMNGLTFSLMPKKQTKLQSQAKVETGTNINEAKQVGILQDQLRRIQASKKEVQNNCLLKLSLKQDELQKNRLKYESQKEQLSNRLKQIEDNLRQSEKIVSQQSQSIQLQIQQNNKLLSSNEQLLASNQNSEQQLRQNRAMIQDLQQKIKQVEANHSHGTNQQIELINNRLSREMASHQNTKLQLAQMREWYKAMQSKAREIESDKVAAIMQLQQLKSQQNDTLQLLKENNRQLNEKLIENERHLELVKQDNEKIQNQLVLMNERMSEQLHAIEQKDSEYADLCSEMETVRKNGNDLLVKQTRQFELFKSELNHKDQQIEQLKSHQDMLLVRNKQQADIYKMLQAKLREKDEKIHALEIEISKIDTKGKFSVSDIERYREKIKLVQREKKDEEQKCIQMQQRVHQLRVKLQTKQQQLDELQKEMEKCQQRWQSSQQKLLNQIAVLNIKIEKECKQKSNLSVASQSRYNHSKVEDSQITNSNQYEEKIRKFLEKQRLMRQNLNLLEYESNRIALLVEEKQENEEKLIGTLQTIEHQNQTLKSRITQLQSLLAEEKERNEGLESEIQLLNSFPAGSSNETQLTELNQRLVEKNKQLVGQISEISVRLFDLQKLESECKLLNQKLEFQKFKNTNLALEIRQAQIRCNQFADENQILSKEFDQLNGKYQQQLLKCREEYQDVIAQLEGQIQSLKERKSISNREYGMDLLQKIEQENSQKDQRIAQLQSELSKKSANQKIEQVDKIVQIYMDNQKQKAMAQQIISLQKELQQLQQETAVLNEQEFKLKCIIQDLRLSKDQLQQQLSIAKEKQDEDLGKLFELEIQIETYKKREDEYLRNVKELQINIDRLKEEKLSMSRSSFNTPIHQFNECSSTPQRNRAQLGDIIIQLNDILGRRRADEQLESALRLMIQNSCKGEQRFDRINLERSQIQEKAKLASKQMQKIKYNIIKSTTKNMHEKSQLTGWLKPCQSIINELIGLSEILAEEQIEQESNFSNEDVDVTE